MTQVSASRSPFTARAVPDQALIAKLFRREHREGARAALETLLARPDLETVDASDISAIILQYRLSRESYKEVAFRLWDVALRRLVSDGELCEEDHRYLGRIQRLLQIPNGIVEDSHVEIVHPLFSRAVRAALEDESITGEEKASLGALLDKLMLGQADYARIYGPLATEILQRKLQEILSDERVSPNELAELGRLAEAININLTFDETNEGLIQRFGEFWKIENGELPRVEGTGLALQRGEVCHLEHPNATWYEPRTKTITTDLGSIGYSMRIARGVYYRSPRIRATRVKRDVLTQIEAGEFYITNKRVIFDGAHRNMSIKLSSLLGFEVWEDAIKLEKATGRSPVVGLGDVERAAVILGAVLAVDS